MKVKVSFTQLCLTLCDPLDGNLLDEVHTFTELYKAMFQVSKHPQHLPRLPCSRKTKRTQANIAFLMTILQTANFSASHV